MIANSSIKILVVDDSETDRLQTVSLLKKHEFQVIEATDGEMALELACKELPNLILMDVMMPNINGFEATRKLKGLPDTFNIPVIMVTSKSRASDRLWAKRQGAFNYISKPCNNTELLDVISQCLLNINNN